MFKTLVVLACAVAAIECGSIKGAGIGPHLPVVDSPDNSKFEKIIGGAIVKQGDHPHQVGLFNVIVGGGSLFFCGGSLIANKWVVTAAHCASGQLAALVKIRAGEHHLDSSSGIEQEVTGKHFTIHPDYDTETLANDIAILELATAFTVNDFVKPIGLPEEGEEVEEGTTCVVSGWGSTFEGGLVARYLHAANVPFVNDEECSADYAGSYPVVDSMICAGEKGKDACQGDSGGPLLCAGSNIAGSNGTLTGVVSWGNGCAREGFPGVYTQVSKFRSFISSVTGL